MFEKELKELKESLHGDSAEAFFIVEGPSAISLYEQFEEVIAHEYDTEGNYIGKKDDGTFIVWYDAAMRGEHVKYKGGDSKKAWEIFKKNFE